MKKIFLDLEDTIITPVLNGWKNIDLINTEKVKTFIKSQNPESVNLFSFALHNDKELFEFNNVCPVIEDALGVKFSLKPTVDNVIKKACCREKRLSVDRVNFFDMSEFWSKDLSFQLFCIDLFKNQQDVHAILIDDSVSDCTMMFKKNNLTLEFINIETLVNI